MVLLRSHGRRSDPSARGRQICLTAKYAEAEVTDRDLSTGGAQIPPMEGGDRSSRFSKVVTRL